MTMKAILMCLFYFICFSVAGYGQSIYLKELNAAQKLASEAKIELDKVNLSLSDCGDIKYTMGALSLLGCSRMSLNGVKFCFPEFSEHAPFKQLNSDRLIIQNLESLMKLVEANPGKVCFIWAGDRGEFGPVLEYAKKLQSMNIPFFFAMSDLNGFGVKVSFF